MNREMNDSRIAMKWTETELQWDSICTALYNHASQSQTEALAWMYVKLVADRIHGQWRISGNGGRVSGLSDPKFQQNWLLAIKARLGVVDGWARQNGGAPYSKYLFEALSNPVLLNLSPKTSMWNPAKDEDCTLLYERLVSVLQLPVSVEWLKGVDQLLQCSILSDEAASKIVDFESMLNAASKKHRKQWQESDPKAVQTIVQYVQRNVSSAHFVNQCLLGTI